MSQIARNLGRLRERIAEAALHARRPVESVTLVGASKTIGADQVMEAIEAGLTDLGENFVQEAKPKITQIRERLATQPVWHMIGHLQTNKARDALDCFDIVESVDSSRLARALSMRATTPLAILLEVYLGSDEDRPGIRPAELQETFGEIVQLPGVSVKGLMTVAPLGLDAKATRAIFREVRELRDQLREHYPTQELNVLSMGMTDDFPLAIEEGATAIRVGRAIFGERS